MNILGGLSIYVMFSEVIFHSVFLCNVMVVVSVVREYSDGSAVCISITP